MIAAVSALLLIITATLAVAEDLPYCGQPDNPPGAKCICQRYEPSDSTLVDFDCMTSQVIRTKPVPRERFNERENTVELIDPDTGAVIQGIPATEPFPEYGLSQQDRDKLVQRCESAMFSQHEGARERCLAGRRAERVMQAHMKELLAIPHVKSVGVQPAGGLPGREVEFVVYVQCPKDLSEAEHRAPRELEGIRVTVAPVPVAIALVEGCRPAPEPGYDLCVHQECDPYPDFETCQPHCWNVEKKRPVEPLPPAPETK